MSDEIFQKHHLSFRVSSIADFVINKFIFANSIINFSITSFQNISDIFRETVIPPLNCDILFQSVICWIIKTHAQSYRVYIHIRHIIFSRNMKLQVVFYITSHWQQCLVTDSSHLNIFTYKLLAVVSFLQPQSAQTNFSKLKSPN